MSTLTLDSHGPPSDEYRAVARVHDREDGVHARAEVESLIERSPQAKIGAQIEPRRAWEHAEASPIGSTASGPISI
eukprot:705487-Prymnesium_polylepis.1